MNNACNTLNLDDPADPSVIDLATLQELRAICMTQQDFAELLEIYLQDLAAKLGLFATAIGNRDLDTICSIAHSMKSSSMSMGAMQLGDLFNALNNAAKDHQQVPTPNQVDALTAMHRRVTRQLRVAAHTLD